MRLFSPTDWILPLEDGKRDDDFEPKALSVTERRDMFFALKEARKKAEEAAFEEWEVDIEMDGLCLDVFRESGQPIAVQREVIVLGNKAPEFTQALQQVREDQVVIDLVRISQEIDVLDGQYAGICW